MKNTGKSKLVMKAAWAEARRGQTIYGGSVRQYLREALRLAWADAKADPYLAAFDALQAEYRSGKIKRTHAPAYSFRSRGNRAITAWYAGQRAQA